MQLEEYFDFLGPNSIRIRGHRIGIEHVIELYKRGYSSEQIALEFDTLSMEEIYATLTYYLHNEAEINAYLERVRVFVEESIREYERQEVPEVVKRLRALREERATATSAI